MSFLDDARRAGDLSHLHERNERSLHPAVHARYGAENLSGVSTLTPMTVAAAEALKTALAFGQVQPNVRNPLVAAFQAAYNQSPEATQVLKVDGLWGPRSEAALAQYANTPAPIHSSTPYTPDAPGPAELRRGGSAPIPPVAPAPPPGTNPLVVMARGLSPQAGYDAIVAFQEAWNATGTLPRLNPDGLWGSNTAGVVARVTGQAPQAFGPRAAPRAPSTPQEPTFVSPPQADLPTLSLPVTAPSNPRPWIFGGTLALAGGLLAWAPWKRGSRDAVTVRTAPRKQRA